MTYTESPMALTRNLGNYISGLEVNSRISIAKVKEIRQIYNIFLCCETRLAMYSTGVSSDVRSFFFLCLGPTLFQWGSYSGQAVIQQGFGSFPYSPVISQVYLLLWLDYPAIIECIWT